jgi:hypothetical protein
MGAGRVLEVALGMADPFNDTRALGVTCGQKPQPYLKAVTAFAYQDDLGGKTLHPAA